ncbi:50S ribosomal protein L35ae [archaeon]|jgi:large subunit ribosomal protein L35Ae|nr:50S ribosomal protein L35ae [archaeon]MBT4417058.1 50S ribosomal protein L35ae [archaeon]
MEGLVNNFRRARHHTKGNHMIITVEGYDSREKSKELLGKKVMWTSPSGKEIKGEIKAVHGNKGAVRAIFERGLPGQSVATMVKVE